MKATFTLEALSRLLDLVQVIPSLRTFAHALRCKALVNNFTDF